MARDKSNTRRFQWRWWLVLLAIGFASGYYVRDQRVASEIGKAVASAREEMERTGADALERARRAGQEIAAGAGVAADSTKAALRGLVRRDSTE